MHPVTALCSRSQGKAVIFSDGHIHRGSACSSRASPSCSSGGRRASACPRQSDDRPPRGHQSRHPYRPSVRRVSAGRTRGPRWRPRLGSGLSAPILSSAFPGTSDHSGSRRRSVHHGFVVLAFARALARPGQGALSGALAASSEEEQHRVHNALDHLPAEIGLLSMRRLVPVMAALPGQLNLLTAEAVAAAVVLGARIAISTASPILTAAADSVGVGVDVVDLGS